jgi:syntaxin 18
MLSSVRKPYLSVDAHAVPLLRQDSHTFDLSDSGKSWSGIRHLTDEERDQIDMQARVILSRCADRVKEMEALEKRAVCFSQLCLKRLLTFSCCLQVVLSLPQAT